MLEKEPISLIQSFYRKGEENIKSELKSHKLFLSILRDDQSHLSDKYKAKTTRYHVHLSDWQRLIAVKDPLLHGWLDHKLKDPPERITNNLATGNHPTIITTHMKMTYAQCCSLKH